MTNNAFWNMNANVFIAVGLFLVALLLTYIAFYRKEPLKKRQ